LGPTPRHTEFVTEDAVVRLLSLFESNAIPVIVDGGWGVDALLGRQTRAHADLDLAVPAAFVARLTALLEADGFAPRAAEDDSEHNFVMTDGAREVDLHSYAFAGNEEIASVGIAYPRASLTGRGRIGPLDVDCIEASWVLPFHTGYELGANDLADVTAIAEKFGFPLLPDHVALAQRLS
jgi:lincosamide nucleotidyltransferase A/C/D/E